MSTPDALRFRDFTSFNISPATFYKWKRELKENQDESKRELRQLREENARLKKMYAALMIDHQIVKEGLEVAKKISARSKKNPGSPGWMKRGASIV